jgi:hypothetical protein
MGSHVVLGTPMALNCCSIGSYPRLWLLTSGIVRAIEFINAIRFIDSDS